MRPSRLLLVVDPADAHCAAVRPHVAGQQTGSPPIVAESVAAALAHLDSGRIDLVVSWFRLADGSVLDLLAADRNVPVVALVPVGDQHGKARAMRAGAAEAILVDPGQTSVSLRPPTPEHARLQQLETPHSSLLGQALESINDCIYITDLEGRLLYTNAAFRETYSWDSEILGRSVAILWARDALHELAAHSASLSRAGERGECVHRGRDGVTFPVQLSRSPVCDELGRLQAVIGVVRDITDRKLASERISQAAFLDPLTQLPNRVLFMDRLAHIVRRGRRDGCGFGVIFLDLDRFKRINDDLGHATGDQVLRVVARRLSSCLREGDTVARLGGDEFAMLLEDLDRTEEARRVALRAMRFLERPIFAAGSELHVDASLGIAVAPPDSSLYDSPDRILHDADIAMYRAKALHGTRFVIFEPSMQERPAVAANLEQELTAALADEQLELHYQPIFDLPRGTLCGFEALIRWRHPERGMLLPSEFLPAAADMGLSVSIGRWVVHHAVAQLGRWRRLSRSALTMTVNLDDALLQSEELVAMVTDALRESKVPGGSLLLDVSEGTVLLDSARAAAALDQLRRSAVGFAIDDFGTSASSIECLHRLPIDTLKIDRSLIARIGVDAGQLRVVRTIVALARQLELRVSAEGIETVEQLALLRTLGCDRGQGHLFSRALAARKASRLLDQGTPAWPRFIVHPG